MIPSKTSSPRNTVPSYHSQYRFVLFLRQALPTQEGLRFLKEAGEGEQETRHLTPAEFSEKFYSSPKGKRILEKLESPVKATEKDKEVIKTIGSVEYANNTLTNLRLLARRELLLWWRDKYQVRKAQAFPGYALRPLVECDSTAITSSTF